MAIKRCPFAGIRVEISPSHDLWMRGARFGTIKRFERTTGMAVVKMDHRQVKTLQRFELSDLSARTVRLTGPPDRVVLTGARVYLSSIYGDRIEVNASHDPYDPQRNWIDPEALEH